MTKENGKFIRKLSYRKQIHWVSSLTKYALISMSLALFVSFGLYSLTEVFSELIHINFEFILISWVIFCGFIFVEYFAILRPLKHKNIDLYEDKLIVCERGNEKHLYFEKIKSIKCKDGFFIIKFKNKKSYSFSFAIERCDYILEQLNKKRPDLFNKKSFMKLRKSIVLSDHSVARFYDLFHGSYKSYTLVYLVGFPFILSLIITLKQYTSDSISLTAGYILDLIATNYLLFIIIGLSFPIITNYIFNKVKQGQLDIDYKNKYRDLKYERKIYLRLTPLYLLVVLILSTLSIKYDLNLVNIVPIDGQSNIYVKSKYLNKAKFSNVENVKILYFNLEAKKYLPATIIKKSGRNIASKFIQIQLESGKTRIIKVDQVKGVLFED